MHQVNVHVRLLLFLLISGRINISSPSKGGLRCEYASCAKRASFGDSHEGKPRYCASHKLNNSVDVRNRKCQYIGGCNKQASFGNVSDRVPSFCATHRSLFHVVIHFRRCMFGQGCTGYAVFGNFADRIARFCVRHKIDGHINVLKPRCRCTPLNLLML
jgi:hypothetical protein